ncbi:CRISPR-associated protein Cmr5 [Paenibacillus shirakamiensis]|uniref:CRISPR type III-B/RAMP module-associated protein Cmr5 n=1 Tax=Paenibacillus shirakamiensis TaxID=1265935 RepID=A0ABS4JDD4_9BACL|nr:type III-B CRISPR module-associated protein Cmr5 [Paenibacillus shirakamiensis]MBP1999090.1 CRISPR-associated protein Cmr5 [Paenibacillus shirakamiensis]
MKSSQHYYAQVAYESIMEVQKLSEQAGKNVFASEYGQLCHRFPSLVLTNGLRLAKIFIQAKSSKANVSTSQEHPYALFLIHMEKAIGPEFNANIANNEYLFISQQVLRASVWFKRYAEAILKVEQATEMNDSLLDSIGPSSSGSSL